MVRAGHQLRGHAPPLRCCGGHHTAEGAEGAEAQAFFGLIFFWAANHGTKDEDILEIIGFLKISYM